MMVLGVTPWPLDGTYGDLGWRVLGIALTGAVMSGVFAAAAFIEARRRPWTPLRLATIAGLALALGLWAASIADAEPVFTGCGFNRGAALGLVAFAVLLAGMAVLVRQRDRRLGVLLLAAASAVLGGATTGWAWRSTSQPKREQLCAALERHADVRAFGKPVTSH
jgi:hypothetical protein